jgi:hypothetical protein
LSKIANFTFLCASPLTQGFTIFGKQGILFFRLVLEETLELSNAKEIKYNKKFPKKEITFFTKNTFLQL